MQNLLIRAQRIIKESDLEYPDEVTGLITIAAAQCEHGFIIGVEVLQDGTQGENAYVLFASEQGEVALLPLNKVIVDYRELELKYRELWQSLRK
jgi:hypothetical protein